MPHPSRPPSPDLTHTHTNTIHLLIMPAAIIHRPWNIWTQDSHLHFLACCTPPDIAHRSRMLLSLAVRGKSTSCRIVCCVLFTQLTDLPF